MKAIFAFLKGFLEKGSFARNIAIFISGSAASFVIGALFTPIITRIYSPLDYGYFAFFNTLLAILVAISSLGFSDALVLPKETKGFINLSRIIVTLSVSIAVTAVLFLIVFGKWFLGYFNVSDLGYWIFALPIIAVLTTYQQIADSYNIRKKQFVINSKARVVSVTSGKSIVSAVGLWIGSSVGGLILGEVVIKSVNFLMLMGKKYALVLKRTLGRFRWATLRNTAIEYKNYPLFIFPSLILVQVSTQIPVFFVSRFYDVQMLGFYALALSLLGIPVQVIGFSMGKVFLQRANEIVIKDRDQLVPTIIKLYYSLLAMGAIGYGLVFGWGEPIFQLVAGKQWLFSGKIASVMAIAFVFQMTAIALGPALRVLKRERLQFVVNLIGSFAMITTLLVSSFLDISFLTFIYLVSFLLGLRFITILIAIFSAARINVVLHIVGGISVVGAIFYLYHWGHQLIHFIF